MPKKIIEYRCLMISPSDVEEERDALTKLISDWNAQIGKVFDVRIELVRSESHAIPEMGGEPQAIINNQLVNSCDFGIAIFWTKLGTPTENYDSGSIEEIRQLMKRGARVLVYFSKRPIPQEKLNTDQYNKLLKFKEELRKEGLLGEYINISNLKEQILLHLTSVIVEFLMKDRSDISQLHRPNTASLPKPDIKIKTNLGFVPSPLGSLKDVLIIQIQNHSPMVVFLGMVSLKMKDNSSLFFPKDSITGEYQKRRELKLGESFTFHIYPHDIFKELKPDQISHITIVDDIDRVYESDKTSFKIALDSLWKKYSKNKKRV